MAEYRLTGLEIDGERVLFERGELHTSHGLDAQTWDVELDGLNVLPAEIDDRIRLVLVTDASRSVAGEAIVTDRGRHDETTKRYSGVHLMGQSTLSDVTGKVSPR